MKMLDSLLDDNERHGTPFSSKNIQEAGIRVISVTEEEEKDADRNANNVTMDIFFSPPSLSMHKRKMQT